VTPKPTKRSTWLIRNEPDFQTVKRVYSTMDTNCRSAFSGLELKLCDAVVRRCDRPASSDRTMRQPKSLRVCGNANRGQTNAKERAAQLSCDWIDQNIQKLWTWDLQRSLQEVNVVATGPKGTLPQLQV
jgi:hypothetical protein